MVSQFRSLNLGCECGGGGGGRSKRLVPETQYGRACGSWCMVGLGFLSLFVYPFVWVVFPSSFFAYHTALESLETHCRYQIISGNKSRTGLV